MRSKQIDIRTVLGEDNPVDLLIKHSSSQVKLEYLVTLFGCRYSDGRPSSATMLRRGVSTKVTMAQAAGDVRAVTGGNAEDLNHVPPMKLQETARQYATVLEDNPGTASTGNATLTACKPSGYREHPVGSLATVPR